MLSLHLSDRKDEALTVLCLGAHGDDIEVGCGGTILKLLDQYPKINIYWVVFSCGENAERKSEIQNSANAFLAGIETKIIVKDFKDGFFPYQGTDVKNYFEQLKLDIRPDLIFTHHRDDLHQDHRLISNLTWNTFRNHLILEYEIIKYDGRSGMPNLFVQLSGTTCKKKIDYLMKFFKTQSTKYWFTKDAFFSLLQIRGLECNSPSKYAEAFYSYKMVI